MTILAIPQAEEASDEPSDTGSPLDILKQDFPRQVDFELMEKGWFVHEGEFSTSPEALRARAAKLRHFIRARPEKEAVLVSHGFFLHYLTGDVNEKGEQTTGWWRETEIRTFNFEDEDGEEAAIVETSESVSARKAEEAQLGDADISEDLKS